MGYLYIIVEHNRRSYTAENVDPTRTHLNIEYCYKPIEQAYQDLFGEALKAYNAKQTRKDRCIDDYYEKICHGKQEKPFYEVIFQIGNKDDMTTVSENGELAVEILDRFMKAFKRGIRSYMCIRHIYTWMKPHPIYTLISFHLRPDASEDCLPEYP